VSRFVRAALAVALLTLLSSAVAVGGSSGTTGRWALIDSARYPGATCVFHSSTADDALHQIRFRAPVVYAVDSTAGVDKQRVGWRWIVQYSNDGQNTWHVEKLGPTVRANATDTYNAQWPRQVGTWNRGTAPLHGAYRAIVSMIWFKANGTIGGQSNVLVTHYVTFYNGAAHGASTYCGDTLG
jgi:hypothetical protein